MPTLRFHGVSFEKLMPHRALLISKVTQIYQIPEDHLTFEVVGGRFFNLEGEHNSYPLVEVVAFKRPIKLEDQVATTVANFLTLCGYAESELYFHHIEGRHYYGNGEHF